MSNILQNILILVELSILVGIGIGILITYPLAGTHPVRWGLAFLALGILGHLYPLILKK